MASLTKLSSLGFNELDLDPRVKGSLYHTYFRSRLIYGLENANLTINDIKELKTLEGKIIKHSFGLHKYCYTEPLLDLMGISSIEFLIKKRELTFLRQLVTNELTKGMVLKNFAGNPHEHILNEIENLKEMTEIDKLGNILKKISEKLLNLINIEKDRLKKPSNYMKILTFLAPKIGSKSWHKTFEYYMNSKNLMRKFLEPNFHD